VLTFRFPLPPNRANARGHWRKGYTQLKKFYAECDNRVMVKLLPTPPAEPWAKATITADLTMRNPMDDDNALSRCKWICDFLVTRGYVADDARTCLRWGGIPTQTISRKSEPCVTVTLEAA
jgi:hypothetical protein